MNNLKDMLISEQNEWANHKGAEFMEIEISSGKVLFLTSTQVLQNWNLVKDELDAMRSASSCEDDDLDVKCDGKYILIKH